MPSKVSPISFLVVQVEKLRQAQRGETARQSFSTSKSDKNLTVGSRRHSCNSQIMILYAHLLSEPVICFLCDVVFITGSGANEQIETISILSFHLTDTWQVYV